MKTAEESDTWCPDEPASSLKVSKRSSKRVSYVAADAELSIQNLSFHVESRGHRTSLLQNICAHVKSSEVLAILGGSGAGKTTLLDAVASEARRGHREGEVLLNSHRLNRAVFRRSCAYVAQSDACCPTLTVFETLFLAASLYQGQASCSKHQQDVQTLLGQVGLDSCQHVKVGDGLLIRGVSGGQRRRVSLAVELLKQPSVLVLDEPTSGLDSKAAEAIVELLRKISVANNLATICTIHQPSSYVFQLFDRLLLLAKGRVCYFGLAEEALRHFETLGFPSASGINPADFLLRITNSDFAASAGQVDWICDAWKEAPEAPLLCRELPPGRLRARFLQQVWKLLGRFLKSHCRDPIAFGGRAILTAVLVSFVCVAYIGARKRTQESVLNYLWAMMWVQQLPAFLCIGAVPNFAREHKCFRKEVKNGLYHPLAHLLADMMVNVPIWFLLALAALIPSVLILDAPLRPSPQVWLLLAAYVGFNDTFAQLCGRCGGAIGIMLFLMQTILNMIFNGTLLAHAEEVPHVMRWLFHVVPSKYTFRSGVKLEFEGLYFQGFEVCSDPTLPVATRAVMPCWSAEGRDVVLALAGQMFPVLDGDFTYEGDLLFILGALILLKVLHGLLMLRSYHGCCTCQSRLCDGCATMTPAVMTPASRQGRQRSV